MVGADAMAAIVDIIVGRHIIVRVDTIVGML